MEKQTQLVLKSVEKWTPGPGQVLIRNESIASNPVDWKIQKYAFLPIQYPTILASDVAGTVEAVGDDVTKFKKGDKVTQK